VRSPYYVCVHACSYVHLTSFEIIGHLFTNVLILWDCRPFHCHFKFFQLVITALWQHEFVPCGLHLIKKVGIIYGRSCEMYVQLLLS